MSLWEDDTSHHSWQLPHDVCLPPQGKINVVYFDLVDLCATYRLTFVRNYMGLFSLLLKFKKVKKLMTRVLLFVSGML